MSRALSAPEARSHLVIAVPSLETKGLPPPSRVTTAGAGSPISPCIPHATVIHRYSELFNTSNKARQPQPEKEWVSRSIRHSDDQDQSKPPPKVGLSLPKDSDQAASGSKPNVVRKTKSAPLIPKKKHGWSMRWAYREHHPNVKRYQYRCPRVGVACDWMFDHHMDFDQHVQEHNACREGANSAGKDELLSSRCGHCPTAFSRDEDLRKHVRALHPLAYDGEMDPHARYQPPPSIFI